MPYQRLTYPPILHNQILDNTAIFKEYLGKISALAITGIEITQATQHYHSAAHLTDAADQGADNSIRLIASKPAWVRVYLHSHFGISGVSGTLEIQRRYEGFLWKTIATLAPESPALSSVPSSHTVGPDYDATRGSLSETLNFIIPAEKMIGKLRLVAKVITGNFSAERTTTVDVTLRQTLRLAGVMIAYDGPSSMAANAPDIQIAAPTLADLQAMSGRALTLFPVQSAAQFRTAGTLTLEHHLQDTSFPASGCGNGWNTLLADVANVRTADGNQPGWIYYGLLPNGVPMGPVGGCGGGGLAVGPINQQQTLAHEAGHAAGLGHAPAGGAPNPDPNYPAYEPYDPTNTPQASIGEYGLDINNGNIASPQNFRDFMAYGGPSWVSPYHYGKLLNNATLNPVTVGIDSPWWKDKVWEVYKQWPWIRFPIPDLPPFDLELPVFPPKYPKQDVVSLIVRIERNIVVEVLHVARTQVEGILEGDRSPFMAYLVGKEGEMLAQAPCLRIRQQVSGSYGSSVAEDGNCTSYIAQAYIPEVAKGAGLEIREGEDVVWKRQAPEKAASVKEFTASFKEQRGNAGTVHLQWRASGPVTEIWLRYSTGEDSEDWRALSTSLTGTAANFDAKLLPAGTVRLQLVAHDGFFSSYSNPISIQLPNRPPEVSILHPVDNHTYIAGQTVRLWGVVDKEDVSPRNAVWLLGRKTIGRGLELWTSLKPGDHTLTFRVETEGGIGKASCKVTVIKPGES
jgi:hypothetical protein